MHEADLDTLQITVKDYFTISVNTLVLASNDVDSSPKVK